MNVTETPIKKTISIGLSKEEVEEAILQYLKSKGVSVPVGPMDCWYSRFNPYDAYMIMPFANFTWTVDA